METTRETKWKKFWRFFFRMCSAGVIALFVLSFASSHFAPAKISALSILGLFFWPLTVLFILGMVVMLWRKEWRWLMVYATALLMGMYDMTSFFQLNLFTHEIDPLKADIKVMTFNVHLMGLYDGKESTDHRDAILSQIQSENPDVFCLQESYWNEKEGSFFHWKNYSWLSAYSVHERATHTLSDGGHFGVLLFSKFPIIARGSIPFENEVNNFCIYADILFARDTVRIYCAHLQSFRLKKKDLKLFDQEVDVEEIQNQSKPLAVQLYRSTVKRSKQVESLLENMKTCKAAKVVCGDFNDTPISYAYHSLSDELIDSFCERGRGIGSTYRGPLPGLRIDYVLHDEYFDAKSYKSVDNLASDHRAVVVELARRN